MASTVLPNGIIIPEKYSRDWYNDLYHNWQELDNLLGGGTPKDGTLTIQKNGTTVGTFSANQATDETINLSVPDVNNGTLTIQQNGTTVDTFTANSSSDKTVNITVPTKTSDLNNDSGFITGVTWNDVADKPSFATVATSGSYNDLSNKPTIPTVNNGTLTIQQNGTTVDTFTANASSNVTCDITVPTKTSDLTNDSGFITSDNTKIPLAGSNQISGSLIPSTDNAYDFGDSSHNLKAVYAKEIRHGLSSGSLVLSGGNGTTNGANLVLYGTSRSDGFQGRFDLVAKGSSDYKLTGLPTGTLTWGSKNVAMREDVVPRSGGAVITGSTIGRVDNSTYLNLCGGLNWSNGATVSLMGKDATNSGGITLHPSNVTQEKIMYLNPNGTWTWDGSAVQLVSDQRYKQQIAQIDDKLLDAWEDVDLVQFKYNDAVEEKSDNARLHTGYVVQQIDDACKSHNVDISKYGLYCHEEYPEETEEVEIEQADGTKVKERKVIREASEHYSLRYTEALIVECAYLRKCIKELRNEIEQLKSSK